MGMKLNRSHDNYHRTTKDTKTIKTFIPVMNCCDALSSVIHMSTYI